MSVSITKRPSSVAAIVVALVLHTGALALLTAGFEPHSHDIVTPPEMAVQLIQPQPARPAAPAPAPTPPQKPKPESKPKPVAKPTPAPRPVAAQPVQPFAAPAPPAITTPSAPPAAPQVKTGITVNASYIAAETAKWYPPVAIRYGDQGTVGLRVYVSASGRVEKVELRKSSDNPLLDQAAIKGAMSLKFSPAQVNGSPVADWVEFSVEFKLRQN